MMLLCLFFSPGMTFLSRKKAKNFYVFPPDNDKIVITFDKNSYILFILKMGEVVSSPPDRESNGRSVMREIDNRYPEIGRPYARTGGGRHHRGLTWLRAAALAVCAAAAMLSALPEPERDGPPVSPPPYVTPEPVRPSVPPVVTPTPSPTP